ncbi:GMC oxidoreductase [Nocardia testacea]|uniref:GMC oxidoreductase n=1 Tax=Nocardia testacea TaxID=248551 RepID=UPI0003022445|nr:GMC oxidoreductase [Nocardia testacea]
MSAFSRRTFLGGTAAAAAGLTVAGTAVASAQPGSGAPRRRTPVVREEHRVIVVGSGFGGGIAALRLAQAGAPVLLLERGKRWATGPNADTFGNPLNPDRRLLWHGSAPQLFGKPVALEPYTGLLDAVVGENMTALCAAGLGGGSLLYQGMSLQPSEAVFNTHFPQELDWRLMDRVHYPRVAAMLRLAVAPDELIAHPHYKAARTFARNAAAAGLPVSKIPMPIDWNFALAETRGEMTASYTNGAGAFGVNNGGKHSVDVTYVAAAEATGLVDVRVMHNVTEVERGPDGRWLVHVDRTDETARVLEKKILTAKALIMAAGSLNTTDLLMRAAAKGLVPDMPDELGAGWGTNADRIYTWTDLAEDFGPEQGGPVVYGSLNWDDPATAHTVIQASIPPLGMDAHTTMLVGYGVSEARGRFVYDPATDRSRLSWPADGDAAIQYGRIEQTVRRVAGPASVIGDTNRAFPSTWHPLGGACMGTVCDLDGRVHDQPGLYVLDGALLPGNAAACNPSMTIAAVAERAMDNLVARDVGPVI